MLTIVLIAALVLVLYRGCILLQRYYVPNWVREPLRVDAKSGARIVLVTGATGFIGQRWCRYLIERGDRLIVLTRDAARARNLFGPHAEYVTSLHAIESSRRIDAIVNLAGAPIMGALWTQRRRRLLLDSRLSITNALVDLIARLDCKPDVLVSMSAIGYYGVRGDEELTEADRGRPIFQSHLCQAWELAAQRATQFGVRVCRLRAGVVLGREAGALPRFAIAARCRVAAVLGSGRQWLSWIHIDDMVRLLARCIDDASWSGAYNATAPEAVTQEQFTRRLAAQFGKGIALRIPERALRLVLGEMSQLLVDGQRVMPMRARCGAFDFAYATLDKALNDIFAEHAVAPVRIMYDPVCPICDMEMRRYSERSARSGYGWTFADVALSPEIIAQCGIDSDTARRRVYVIDSTGRMRSGLDALMLIWAAVPHWRMLARALRLPIVNQVANFVYDLALAPTIWRWSTRRRARGVKGIVASHS